MPRGIPNAKKDDLGMKYTTFHVPLQLVYLLRNCNLLPLTYDRISLRANPKLTASNYLKYESQSVWVRNAAKPCQVFSHLLQLVMIRRRYHRTRARSF